MTEIFIRLIFIGVAFLVFTKGYEIVAYNCDRRSEGERIKAYEARMKEFQKRVTASSRGADWPRGKKP